MPLIRHFDDPGRKKRTYTKQIHISPEVYRVYRKSVEDKICITLALSLDGTIYRRETKIQSGYSTSVLETSARKWTITSSTNKPEQWLDNMLKSGWTLISQAELRAIFEQRAILGVQMKQDGLLSDDSDDSRQFGDIFLEELAKAGKSTHLDRLQIDGPLTISKVKKAILEAQHLRYKQNIRPQSPVEKFKKSLVKRRKNK